MPKIKNLANGPVSVYCGGISMAVPPGEFLESDGFTADELKFYGAHPDQFEVVGDAVEGSGLASQLALVTKELDDYKDGFAKLREAAGVDGNFDVWLYVSRSRKTLAEIVALFGSDDVNSENVKDAVAKLIQDLAEKPEPTTEPQPQQNQPTDLAAAIALLDDTNDEHWTQAGLPDISTLKTLTGGDVTRAQVDQLPEGDKRVRKV